MSVVGEAALSVFFEVLFKKIASSDLPRLVRDKEVLSEIKKWEKMLKKFRNVLDDAEEKQMTTKSVKDWLCDLQDLAYDVEDILDEFATESLRRKSEGEPEASTSKVRKFIPNCFTPRAFMFNYKMDSKVKEITSRLQAITEQRNDLGLKEIVGGSSTQEDRQRHPGTSLPDEYEVFGRDEERRKIIDLILRDDATKAKLGVLPIVGMGGLGKTTLARLVYNDGLMEQHFPTKAWVSVSDDFDNMRITKGILESITSKPCDLKELDKVQCELQKELAGKKFLIVLDDVWTERYEDWIALRPPFMDGAVGSRIIVTTRSMIVAQNMRTIEHHTLERISDADCWMLFRSHAFESNTDTIRNEDIICEKVKSRCAGLPLAARTLGGLLRSKRRDKWEAILDSELWRSQDGSNSILPVLRLSYFHLPSHLKRCFSYCAIFPQEYEFTEMEVVLLWMAEGLISTGDNNAIEVVGSEHFHDLLSRSFFQASSSGESKFVMHDLVNDLARTVAGETCFRLEDEALVWKQVRRERARYSSYICGKYDGIKKFQPFYEMPRLRAFLPLSLRGSYIYSPTNYLTSDVLSNLLPKLRSLRVLSFKGYEIYELPESIGDLKHLRYLDLSFTSVVSLPESIVLLFNLQTLNLRRCENIKELPESIEELINLRHLDVEGAGLEDGLPFGVMELVSLRTLSEFSVSRVGGAALASLKSLKCLRGKLCISRLENVRDASHGRELKFKEKKDLHILSLGWSEGHTVTRDERFERELLDELQPHVEFERLDVKEYGGIDFPDWVGDPSFHNLVFLRLERCSKCTSIPKLGLLRSLKNLSIEGMYSVKSVGGEFYGEGCSNPFPSLETLCFESMREWVDWDPCGFKFPCLHELTICQCPKLIGKLPNSLLKLKKLRISDCEKFRVCLPSLPMVSELIISRCKEVDVRNMVGFGSPNTLELSGISKLKFKTEGLMMEQLMKTKDLRLYGNTDFIFDDSELPHFSNKLAEEEKDRDRMMLLQKLMLGNSESFDVFFLQQPVFKQNNFTSLQHLQVSNCPKLVSFEGFSLSIVRSRLSTTLKRLEITRCENLQNLHLPINLEFLSLFDCPSLISLSSSSRGEFRPNLQHIDIRWCSKLESIAETLSSSLHSIKIESCANLRHLPKDLHKLINLSEIQIDSCESLVSFPEGGLPTTCLKTFHVCYCQKLETLPHNIHNITSLQTLTIWLPIGSFPRNGFPTSLTTLDISYLIDCKPLFEWGLHKFTSLTTLSIFGGCPEMLSFPCEDMGMMLPPSLMDLSIGDFPKLEYLSNKGFQNLTSLDRLRLSDCPNLTSLPKDGLPLSLLQLDIFDCPLLKQRCEKDEGQHWLKIVHIPFVQVDFRDAFKPVDFFLDTDFLSTDEEQED